MSNNKEIRTATEGHELKVLMTLGDLVLALEESNPKSIKAYAKRGFKSNPRKYKIDGSEVEECFIPEHHELVILQTNEKFHFRDFDNNELDEDGKWRDYYFEPYTKSLYRSDDRGYWFDIEGYRLTSSVFLKGDVLCSLNGKVSKRSKAFEGLELLTSPNEKLIQIGKLVFDETLEKVEYFGEKVTGIGKNCIKKGPHESYQEVYLSLNKTRFIEEFSQEPFLINKEEVERHVQTLNKGDLSFEIFSTKERNYAYRSSSGTLINNNGIPLRIELDSFITLGVDEVVKVQWKDTWAFYNAKEDILFSIKGFDKELVLEIDPHPIYVKRNACFNVEIESRNIVYNAGQKEILSVDNGSILPDRIEDSSFMPHILAFIHYADDKILLNKKKLSTIDLGRDFECVNIEGEVGEKLIEAIDESGNTRVIDARKGLAEMKLAVCNDRNVLKTVGNSFQLGEHVLQNIIIETLGGSEQIVVDINSEELKAFTFPDNMLEYPEQNIVSNFSSNPIVSINFNSEIIIDDHLFFEGKFKSYVGTIHTFLMNASTLRPLHLEGLGNRNELILELDDYSTANQFFLGHHRMLGSRTLTEDLKENQLLFSANTLESWLPFRDTFLPIMKRVVVLKKEADWDYHLFELQSLGEEKEYIAVEKNDPHRILVENQQDKYVPKIVKRKKKTLRTPEEVSLIKKIFLRDPGILAGLD